MPDDEDDEDRPKYSEKYRPDGGGYPTVDFRGEPLVIIRCSNVGCRRRLRLGTIGETFKPRIPEAQYAPEAPRILCPHCFSAYAMFDEVPPIAQPTIKPVKPKSPRKQAIKRGVSEMVEMAAAD